MNDKKKKTNGEKKKRGVKSTYDPSYAERAYHLCLLGLTNKDLAIAFGKGLTTIEDWMRGHDEFAEAIKKGRKHADAKVALSLYQKAIGYSHPEDKVFTYKGEVIVVPTTRYYAPDTGAAIFWLKNRQKDKWRDVWNLEHSGKDGGPISLNHAHSIDLSDLDDSELELLDNLGVKLETAAKKKDRGPIPGDTELEE